LNTAYIQSLSSRRAWIEISEAVTLIYALAGRSPRGERGLKSYLILYPLIFCQSLSSRRAWIEIRNHHKQYQDE
jgi:hypothetical protein